MSEINQLFQKDKLPELGLVCITTSNEVRFRTVTRNGCYS